MQYIPLAQEALFLPKKAIFMPKDLQKKVRKSRQILIRDKIGLKFSSKSKLFGGCHPCSRATFATLPGSVLGLLVLYKLFPLFLWQGHISIIPYPDPYEIAFVFFSCFPMENKILCTPSFAHILDVLAVGLSGSVAGRLRRGQRLHREPGLRDGQLCTGSSYIST